MANPLQFLRSITATPTTLTKPKQSSLEAIGTAKPLPTKEPTPEHETVEPVIKGELKKLCITTKLPKNVAILHIFTDEHNKYSVKGGQAEQKEMVDLVEKEDQPDISFIKEAEEKQIAKAKKIKEDMREFSQTNLICKWIRGLKKKFDKNLYLVIVDHTTFRIPWEMLELSPDEYIGSVITTVRWREVFDDNDNSGEDYLTLQLQDNECCGIAVGYFLDTELAELEREIEVFQQLEGKIFRSREDINTIRDFHDHLHSNNADHSFIYLSCHGTLGNNPDTIVLGSEKDEKIQLKLKDLRDRPLNPQRKSQGIVFMNACYSAHEETHPRLKQSYRRNFIELFLRQRARGVIGTLGAVISSAATQFACDLIEESLQPSPRPIAEILRNLRSKAVKNYIEQPDSKNLKSLINAFMYVYYGNPKTVVRLTRRGE